MKKGISHMPDPSPASLYKILDEFRITKTIGSKF